MPDLEPEHIIAMHLASLPNTSGQHKVNSMMTGGAHHQILLPSDPLPPASMIPTLISASNCALANLSLQVESAHFAYKGIALATSAVASASDLDLVSAAISCALGRSFPTPASLPQLWSYLKIIDVSYFVPGTTFPVKPAYILEVVHASPMTTSFDLVGTPWVMHNSPSANTATVWFNLWDSQSGANAKALINKALQFGASACTMRGTRANPGVPQCQRCWHWGHSTLFFIFFYFYQVYLMWCLYAVHAHTKYIVQVRESMR
jgi:hypothetical protein